MIDFAKLAREHYENASPEVRARIDEARRERAIDLARPRAVVKAIRKNCITGEEREIDIMLVVRPGYDEKQWLCIEQGGSTGYESIPFDRLDEAIEAGKGWAACFGTDGRWDALTVPVESLRLAREALK